MTDARTPSVNLSPSDYVIIGGTGDLALRKILPALFWRYLDGQITSDYRIAAASRRDISPKTMPACCGRSAMTPSPVVLPARMTGPTFWRLFQ